MRHFVYKVNALGRDYQSLVGNFWDIFDRGTGQEYEYGDRAEVQDFRRLGVGDRLICYQTDKNELVGTATVAGWKGDELRMKVDEVFARGIRVRDLKRKYDWVATMPAFKQGPIRTIYDISDEDAGRLIRLARKMSGHRARPAGPRLKEAHRGDSLVVCEDQGRGAMSAAERKAIELYAMARAERFYARKGFECHNTSSSKPYDYLCTRKMTRRFVEVKGTKGEGQKVIVTRGEVLHAARHARDTDLVIVNHIRTRRTPSGYICTGGQIKTLVPWTPRTQGALDPIAYDFAVP